MKTNSQVFLDANILIYSLDETSEYYSDTVTAIQKLLDKETTLCTSHHVIEEVLYITRKISSIAASEVIKEISKIPNLVLIEPDATLGFAKRYAKLSDEFNLGINDALLLQLMIDAGINSLFSYDKKFINKAIKLGIKKVA
jgi:predicted nucleic acid-binding protein